ncbi:MAG: hypothetical protein FWD66_11410 [Paludibacter sp.]|nr:hypothetical protein [Paludibacter sp.]
MSCKKIDRQFDCVIIFEQKNRSAYPKLRLIKLLLLFPQQSHQKNKKLFHYHIILCLFGRLIFTFLTVRCPPLTHNVPAALRGGGFHRHSDESQRCKVTQNFGRDKPDIS